MGTVVREIDSNVQAFICFLIQHSNVLSSSSSAVSTGKNLAVSSISLSMIQPSTSATSISTSAISISTSATQPTTSQATTTTSLSLFLSSTSTSSASATYTGPPITSQGKLNFTHYSCISEPSSSHLLASQAQKNGTYVTIEKCLSNCWVYQYAGVEYGREFWCGNSLNTNGDGGSGRLALNLSDSNC
jgi:hypothetical protein